MKLPGTSLAILSHTPQASEIHHDSERLGIVMEDGASVHRSKVTSNWRVDHRIDKMVWSPYSPDMNPMDNVWWVLKDYFNDSGRRQPSVEELMGVVQ
ncbi:hypothetical protein BGX27_010757, partial [Mortierella sp. AM989]